VRSAKNEKRGENFVACRMRKKLSKEGGNPSVLSKRSREGKKVDWAGVKKRKVAKVGVRVHYSETCFNQGGQDSPVRSNGENGRPGFI